MTTKSFRNAGMVLLAALAVGSANEVFAGGGGGGGGGFGGGGGGRGGGGGAAGGGFGQVTSTRDYPNSTMNGPVSVSIDPETGGLIVITDDKTFNNVTNVINGVDKPKPQVLIKCLLLEVTHDNALDFGVEGSYNHNFGSSALVTNLLPTIAGGVTTNVTPASVSPFGSLGNNFGLQQQGTIGSSIGTTTMPTGAGLYSVLGNDYTATVRAIQSANNLEVLSRPSILVRNNQPATINVGQTVPIVSSVTYAANTGLPIVTPTPQQVGITLQVTPFIHDRMVEMIVTATISALSSTTVQIAPGYNAPVIDNRSANTVVIVPDGQTAIIGGLMENSKAAVDTKIPLLGDIPLLGLLFKRTQRDHSKTELMIFLTPTVAETPDELSMTTASESARLEMSRRSFTQKEYGQMMDTNLIKTSKPDKH